MKIIFDVISNKIRTIEQMAHLFNEVAPLAASVEFSEVKDTLEIGQLWQPSMFKKLRCLTWTIIRLKDSKVFPPRRK